MPHTTFMLLQRLLIMKFLGGSNKNVVAQKSLPSLATCVLLDFAGYATYAIPFFGEFLDLLWAPISAIIYWRLFGFRRGFLGGIFSFAEELMPGLDFIPTFTITWFVQFFKSSKSTIYLTPVK